MNQAQDNAHKVKQLEQQVELLTERLQLLEQQNHRLASLLHQHGIRVRELSGVALELPPAIAEPLSGQERADLFSSMSEPEQRVAGEHIDEDTPIYYGACSDTRIDVGQWLANGMVWVLALEQELFLFAAGRKPFVERVPFGQVYRSLYNHVTGQLVLAPSHGLRLETLELPPRTAYQFLAQIYQANQQEDMENA